MADPEKQAEQPKANQQKLVIGKFLKSFFNYLLQAFMIKFLLKWWNLLLRAVGIFSKFDRNGARFARDHVAGVPDL